MSTPSRRDSVRESFQLKDYLKEAYCSRDSSSVISALEGLLVFLDKVDSLTEESRNCIEKTQQKWKNKSDFIFRLSRLVLNKMNGKNVLSATNYVFNLNDRPKSNPTSTEDTNQITSRHYSRTQVYSGRKKPPTVPSLRELCLRCIQKNIEEIQNYGALSYDDILPLLERCKPSELSIIAKTNPKSVEKADHLYKRFCQSNKQIDSLPPGYTTWKAYFMKLNETEEKRLSEINEKIRLSQQNKPKERTTKIATRVDPTRSRTSTVSSTNRVIKDSKNMPIGMKRSLQLFNSIRCKRRK